MSIFFGHGFAAALLAVSLCASALAQAPASVGRGVQLLQRIDDELYGVDPISLTLLDRHHVAGVMVRVSATAPNAALGYSQFVVNCQAQKTLAMVASAADRTGLPGSSQSARARLESGNALLLEARLLPTKMLDASRLVAEFACQSSQFPSRSRQIAQDLYERGGPSDSRSAWCDLQPDGLTEIREDVEVRFSDSEKVVSVNHQWLTSGVVNDNEIIFGRGAARWRIDRHTAEASLIRADGRTVFAGSCGTAPARP